MTAEQIGIIGCGEAFDSGYGNNSCLLFGKAIPTVLFDCGYQIPERLWALPEELSSIDAVYLTHFHADHAMGLAPLIARYGEEGRKRPLIVFGAKGVDGYVRKLLELAYPGIKAKIPYKLEFSAKESGDRWTWRKLRFECAATRHSIKNLSVRVGLPSGKSVFVSGDGLFSSESRTLAARSDLVLHEAYTARSATMVHSSVSELRDALQGAACSRIVLTHFRRTERGEILDLVKRIRKEDPRWSVAEPGQVIPV